MNGLTVQEFADLHGFKADTVMQVVRRHWGRPTKPWGDVSQAILNKLEVYQQQAFMACQQERRAS